MLDFNAEAKEALPTNVIEELASLRQEVAKLRQEKIAFVAQRKLLENLVTMAMTPEQEEVLLITLQEALDVSSHITGAEKGSLFLVNSNGVITESILTQTEQVEEKRRLLINTVLDKGLAGWVFRHRKVGLINDTETDCRWHTLPNQPYVARSALAVPVLRSNEFLGILTLLHSKPGHFTPEFASLMDEIADHIALVLENARLWGRLEESYYSLDRAKQEIEAVSKALNNELDKGKQIQKDFLPNEIPDLPNWEIAACFYPARQVAGDFYDAFMLPGDYLGLVIADVCDKGVGAALFMALFRSLIRVFSGQTRLNGLSIVGKDERLDGLIEPNVEIDLNQINALKAVALTNNYIAQEHERMNMFATLFFGVLNPENGCLTYINGGHEPLLLIGESGIKETLKPTGPAVGMMDNMKFKIKQTHLAPGDILFGYTDGVPEARDPSYQFFTAKRLLSILEEPVVSADNLVERIKTCLFEHIKDAPQFDDITILAVRREKDNLSI